MTLPPQRPPVSACARRLRGSVAASGARAFTLVEMLVVVSIILLVAVMALPSVTSLSKSAARRSAISQAMGVLDQARAIALSQGVTVYVAFANADPAIPEDYRYRSYAVFREAYYPEHRNYQPDGETKAAPYRLEIARSWTKLPDGVAFQPVVTEAGAPKAKFPFALATAQAGSSGKEVELFYLRFNAMGLLELPDGKPWPEKYARIGLFEGFVDAASAPVMTNAARADAAETVVLSLVTGRAHREEAKSAG